MTRLRHMLVELISTDSPVRIRLLVAACTLTLCITLGDAAHAQFLYAIDRPVVDLSLEYRKEDEFRYSPQIGSREEDTDTFWQRLEVASKGWIYDPDLLLFSFSLQPEWKQQDLSASSDFTRGDDNRFLGYYLDAHLLRQKTHSLKLFLRRGRNEFTSSLSHDNVTDTEITRGVWLIDSMLLPTSITLENNKLTFDDFILTFEDSDILRIDSRHKSEKHQFTALAELLEQDRQIDVQRFDVTRLMLNVNSHYKLSNSMLLTSGVFGLDSESDLDDNQSVMWSERLRVQHRENLRSEYALRRDTRESAAFRSEVTELSAAVEHELYENLTTRLELKSSRDDLTNGEVGINDARLNLRYRRSIPAGVLSITNTYNFRNEDNDIDAVSSQVINESAQLDGTSPVFLNRARIDPSSIIVTDATSATSYVEDMDYVVSVIGDSISIERTLFGSIADGETVLVDYVYETRSPFESDRFGVRFGVNVNLWQVLRLYYNRSRLREDLISGALPTDLADDTIELAGATIGWKWSRTSLEYEDRDTVRTPLTRWRFQQSVNLRIGKMLSAGVAGSYSETDFTESTNDSRSVGLSGNLRWNLRRFGEIEIIAFSRDVKSEAQKSNSESFSARWSARFGAWYSMVRYEMINNDDVLTEQIRDRNVLTLRLQRTFR